VEHPLLGVGAGQYPAYAEWLGVTMPHPITNRLSSLFQLPAETGLLGTVAWVGFLVTLIHYGYGYLREREEILPRFVWFSLVLLSLAALVYSIHEVLLSWCLLAVFSAITSEVPPPAEEIMQPLILQYKVERRIG
jgi:hypothetical protein